MLRSEGVAEQIRAAALAQHLDDLGAAGGEPAHGAAHGFAQRARDDVDTAQCIPQFDGSTACLANEAGGMAFVHHDEGIILVGEVADAANLGDVTVHREDAVRDDDLEAVSSLVGGLQLLLEVLHVVVGEPIAGGLARRTPSMMEA